MTFSDMSPAQVNFFHGNDDHNDDYDDIEDDENEVFKTKTMTMSS